MRIGVISDTHGLLHPEACARLAGVDHAEARSLSATSSGRLSFFTMRYPKALRRGSPTAVVVAILGFSNVAYGQSSISQFADVAGRWTGQAFANNYSVSLEIDAAGKFKARALFGSEIGDARLDNGHLVIPLVKHQGTLHLVLDGETLRGPGAVAGRSGTVTLTRADRTVNKQ